MNELPSRKKVVFISYTHQHRELFKELQTHLQALEKTGNVEIWADERIRPGDEWRPEIARKINEADAAILLISAGYISSEFIDKHELPALLNAAKVRKCRLLLLKVMDYDLTGTALMDFQLVENRSLLDMRKHTRAKVFNKVATAIRETALARREGRSQESLADLPPEKTEDELYSPFDETSDVAVDAGTTTIHPNLRLRTSDNEDRSRLNDEESIHWKSIWDLMKRYLADEELAIELPEFAHPLYGFTIRDLEKLCVSNLPDADVKHFLDKARGFAFGEKYGKRKVTDDERFTQDIALWVNEVKSLLIDVLKLGEDWKKYTALNVGIGNGPEGMSLYENFGSFLGADISDVALAQAKAHYGNVMTRKLTSAEKLEGVQPNTIDVYLSFRTFQSTLLDKDRALYAARIAMKSPAVLLISIPNQYRDVDENNKNENGDPEVVLKPGLLRADTGRLDRELPYKHIGEIRRMLFRFGFKDVGVQTGLFEVYVYGRKPG